MIYEKVWLDEKNDLPIIPTPVKVPTPKVPTPKVPTLNLELSNNENANVKKIAKNIIPPKRKTTRKIKNTTIIPKTKKELLDIYKETSQYINEDDLLVKIARSLGSRKNFDGRTRIAVYNDIIEKAAKMNIIFI